MERFRAETRYVRSGDGYIALQVRGQGPVDLVWVGNWATQVEDIWTSPFFGPFVNRLTRSARVVVFDQRGTGLSDPVAIRDLAPLERWADEVLVILDALGIRQAVVAARGGAGMLAAMFAAAHPDRTQALVLIAAAARFVRAPDYPLGLDPARVESWIELQEATWGTGAILRWADPGAANDERLRTICAREQRHACAPATWAAATRMVLGTDIRDVLPSIRVPTLVVHYDRDPWCDVQHGRYLADHIAGATYVELPGERHAPGEDVAAVVEEFLTGAKRRPLGDRFLATVLFTDIVESTARAAALGDARWTTLLREYDEVAAHEVGSFGGRVIKSTGDGLLATFDGPARAVRCGLALREAARLVDLEQRIGVHTGEVEPRGEDIAGLAVHIAARVMSEAAAGEVLVSRTVKDLVAGSGLTFVDRGTHALKGIPDDWQLFLAEE